MTDKKSDRDIAKNCNTTEKEDKDIIAVIVNSDEMS